MKVHFIGIGGIGLSGLAHIYLEKGEQVQGSDLVESEITKGLQKRGANVWLGHSADKISSDIDLLVYSEAVSEDNMELVRAKELGVKCLSGAQAIAEFSQAYYLIAVSGMHGKTTTASMLAHILVEAGLDPTYIIGAKNGWRLGQGKYLIIEADDYKAKFLHYSPDVLVLTNIEEEHLDYFKGLEHIMRVFGQYINQVKQTIVYNGDDEKISNLKSQILNLNLKSQIFSLKKQAEEAGRLQKILQVPGKHNISNALAALEAAKYLGVGEAQGREALENFRGVWRRLEEKEFKIKNLKFKIINDYAHHPTEIKAVFEAVKEKYPNKRVWAVFQPHQYQRTFKLFDKFVKVLSKHPFDKLIITDIYDVAGRENQEAKVKVSAQKLVKQCFEMRSQNIEYVGKAGLADYLKKSAGTGEWQALLIMTAGDIYKLVDQIG